MDIKVICAQQAHETIPNSEDRAPWQVPKRWLEILFDRSEFPQGSGLYMAKQPINRPNAEFMICTERLYLRFSEPTFAGIPLAGARPIKVLVGIRMSLLNLEFDLHMTPPLNRGDYVYRPRMIRFSDRVSTRAAFIHLGWDEHPPTFAGKVALRNEFGFSERGARRVLARSVGLARKK